MHCWQNKPGACRTLESSAANRPRRPLFCRFLAPARGTPDSYALKRYDSAAPWNNHAAANPAKNGIGGADFRYRRPKSDRLLGSILLAFLCLLLIQSASASCPLVPADFMLPPEARQQVDLERELAAHWQAGGEIVLICTPDGSPKVGRLARPPSGAAEEEARRVEQFALARRVNMARKAEAHPLGLPMAAPQQALLERFALSDAGAIWLREIADDTLRLFNKGYLEYDKALWKRSVKLGRLPPLSKLLTGRLTETALFAGDAQVFKFSGYAGPGAMAHPGAIGLGDAGLSCQFPTSSELVDPLAIISHEFGHTRYGDPASAGTLIGEARTVELYENPVRIRNGYEPRSLYFERINKGVLEAKKGSLVERLLRLDREKGISIKDMSTVDRYHCDCPGPLPIIIDCEVRERTADSDLPSPAYDQDCKVNWKPDVPRMPIFQKLAPLKPKK